MEFWDTHCHIHSADYPLDGAAVVSEAAKVGVSRLLCVGTDAEDSEAAVTFVADKPQCWASIGIHPHEASRYLGDTSTLERFAVLATDPNVVAVGECGLDYFYNHSPKSAQIELLHWQISLAQKHQLPMVFHVRDAFTDFWEVFDQYKNITGVVHSFTATQADLDAILARGLFIGINGIATFMKPGSQLDVIKQAPLQHIVLETDAPFLTPVPFRGKMNEPKHIRTIAEYLADLRGESIDAIAMATTANANHLFTVEK